MTNEYILSNTELAVLLTGLNSPTAPSTDDTPRDLTRDEIIEALRSMTAAGFISSDGERFAIEPELKRLLLAAAQPDAAARVYGEGSASAQAMIYLDETAIAILRPMKEKEGYMRLSGAPVSEAVSQLTEAELLPEFVEAEFPGEEPEEPRSEAAHIVFEKSAVGACSIVISQGVLTRHFTCSKKECAGAALYSAERFKKCFDYCIWGKTK